MRSILGLGHKKDKDGAASSVTHDFNFWQDREIRFDTFPADLYLRPNAEEALVTMREVEDTQGNGGRAGTLTVTNLRLTWMCDRRRTVNLSIGFNCIQNVFVQETESKLYGGGNSGNTNTTSGGSGATVESLVVSGRNGSGRFRFIFTCNGGGTIGGGRRASMTATGAGSSGSNANYSSGSDPRMANTGRRGSGSGGEGGQSHVTHNRQRLFTAVQTVWKAYNASKPFREVRVRNAIVSRGNLIALPEEQVLSKIPHVTNVSKDKGTSGSLVVTNARVVWFATDKEEFNVSIPYMQLTAVRSQNSKFGRALVLETAPHAGGYILGFRVTPPERLMQVYGELCSLWEAWRARPVLGIKVELADLAAAAAAGAAGETGKPSAATTSPTSASASAMTNGNAFNTIDNNNNNNNSGGGRVADGAEVLAAAPDDAFAAYYADEGQKGADRRPVYDESMGLAVEKLRKGVTIAQLWEVLPS